MAKEDLLSGDWPRLRARIKEHWHALTDDDLALIAGSRTVLDSVLREKYGYTGQQAQKEIEQFLNQMIAPTHV